MPSRDYNFEMNVNSDNQKLYVVPTDKKTWSSVDDKAIYDIQNEAVMFTNLCSYKQYKHRSTGKCMPCKKDHFSLQPFGSRCYSCEDHYKLQIYAQGRL